MILTFTNNKYYKLLPTRTSSTSYIHHNIFAIIIDASSGACSGDVTRCLLSTGGVCAAHITVKPSHGDNKSANLIRWVGVLAESISGIISQKYTPCRLLWLRCALAPHTRPSTRSPFGPSANCLRQPFPPACKHLRTAVAKFRALVIYIVIRLCAPMLTVTHTPLRFTRSAAVILL